MQIKSAKPRAKPYKLADSGGLYLFVQPSGSKLWRYQFRISRVEGLQALGSFPKVIRDQAEWPRLDRGAGRSPRARRRRAGMRVQASANTNAFGARSCYLGSSRGSSTAT
ncbi:Arm DNA-binding domain-containing protein [Pseudoxanthomonas mexicana]